VFRQVFFDLAMPGNGLDGAGFWIAVPVVFSAMANENAAQIFDPFMSCRRFT
jgi:hypothetical protein